MNRRITRARALVGAAALLCVLVVPIAATGSVGGSGGPEATTSGVKKQVKKLKRRVKKLQTQVEEIAKQPGPQGAAGDQGVPGQDATKLFAYFRDFAGSPSVAGNVEYGDGVTAVSDPAGNSAYTVSFNQSVENCVVQAVPGVGDPPGTPAGLAAVSLPTVNMAAGGANDVDVTFRLLSGAVNDSAFLITAFC